MKLLNFPTYYLTLKRNFLRVTSEPVTAKKGSLYVDRVPQAALVADLKRGPRHFGPGSVGNNKMPLKDFAAALVRLKSEPEQDQLLAQKEELRNDAR